MLVSPMPNPPAIPATLADLVGSTPLVPLDDGPVNGVRLLGKLESQNPGGSVKDRPARRMILGAEQRGLLGPGVRLVEATSGNTGIALAMIAAARGYAMELIMPETATAERVALMRAYGAEVILTAATGGMEGAIDLAREKVARGGYVMLDQFSNEDNWRAHFEATGPEIWAQTGQSVRAFVSAMGTTGTIMGVSRFLKAKDASIRVVGCQPADGACIPGIRRWPEAYLPKIYEPARVDELIDIAQEDAENEVRRLARERGILVGISSGGAVFAAREVCRRLATAGEQGSVVCILCDRGDRYLSAGLF
jgi:S-sulfo-L-cysteine synthase (O-acetyl-L-serine-dependent)